MATTVRIVVQVTDEQREALRLAATLRRIDMGDVIGLLIEGAMPDGLQSELEQVRELAAKQAEQSQDRGHGRKPHKS